MDPSVFFPSHAMTPPGMHHVLVPAGGNFADILVQPDITETLESGHVGNMGSRGVCCAGASTDHYSFEACVLSF